MLTLLKIRNIAVVEAADICFGQGFSVLTGETGAGKSMIIDAVRMILGDRTSRDIIRTGEKKASVYAEFTFGDKIPSTVRELVDKEGRLRLSREITAEGKNICRVNDRTVQTAFLRTIGEKLVDIHGQHDSRNLLDPDRHIDYVDVFAGLEEAKEAYRRHYAELKTLAREIRSLKLDEGEKLRRIEMLEYQISEIKAAGISQSEETELSDRKLLLANAEKLATRITSAAASLGGGDGAPGASEAISDAIASLSAAARISPKYEAYISQLQEASIAVDDVLTSLENERDELTFSPGELNAIEERLDLYYRLKRKYGATAEDVLSFLENAERELSEITYSDEKRARMMEEYAGKKKALLKEATGLSEKRREAAEILSRRIENELAYLDMPHTRFSVEFYTPEEEGASPFNANGIDTLEFFLSVNKGESLKPLSKTASGGELSRIMLAMKNVLTDKDSIPVQIFDEIDTGISGRAAQKVADKMWTLARGRQVLCVTHLSQLAAMADADYLIEKGEKDGRTATGIRRLDEKERPGEIARINVGANVTDLALESAEQMLSRCRETQNRLLDGIQS